MSIKNMNTFVSSSKYVTSNDNVMNEQWTGKDGDVNMD